jgi:Ca-activated chloride channel family protein
MIEATNPDLVAPGITTTGDYHPILTGVQVINTVSGFVMTSVIRQTYLNDGNETVEITYTFPLTSETVLRELSVQINGKTMRAQVLPKKKAERDYESAIESGDTPVMVQAAKHGLYNANIGNILPGEQLAIELHTAQPLKQIDGTFRIRIPTVISSNYGDSEIDGGLEPHQTPVTKTLEVHPFSIELRINDTLAKSTLNSPSHSIHALEEGQQRIIRLTEKAYLDRDFILLITPEKGTRASALVATHAKHHLGMVSFTPEFKNNAGRALNLKVLVDCSGSMAGERIDQAKAALKELMLHLNADDRLSLTVFGSDARHLISTLTPCSEEMIRSTVKAINNIDANLGGTEMHDALEATYAIEWGQTQGNCDILLITDGDIWNIDAVVASAITSDHRVFAMGVGSAPGESLLNKLATQTGGICDLLSRNEDMTTAVIRLFKRMRQGQELALNIDWGSKPTWQSKLPKLVAPGETIHVLAKLKKEPLRAPVVQWQAGSISDTENLEILTSCDAVIPLAAAQRIKETTSAKKREALALEFQLISDTTNLLLVYERAEDKKANGEPVLKKIQQMLPKGWGGTSYEEVSASISIAPNYPRVYHSMRVSSTERINRLSSSGMEDFEVPAFLRKSQDIAQPTTENNEDLFTPSSKGELPYKLLSTLIGAILSGQTLDPNLISNNKPLMAVWLACQDDAETPDQAFAIFILALEMLLHPNLAATIGKSIPTSQLNKVRKYGAVKNETPVQARYQELKQAFPTVTLHRW